MSPEGTQLLLKAGRELGLDLGPHIPRFVRLYQMLVEANRRMNLTAIRDERGIVLKHFVDSLTCLLYPGFADGAEVVDVGTGAGFPGLPLAIVRPGLRLCLLEATQKKARFVASAIEGLGLDNAEALWGRAEELARGVKRETYHAAVVRAVASLPVVAELALPLVRVGGFVLLQKGPEVEGELGRSKGALEKLGGALEGVLPLSLPVGGEARRLVVLRKRRPTPEEYPRKAGVPAKNPLS
ncbi:Ribosomal RNA small subunit methyltransferase G [Meiothermus luteus]|uniref:Ribosomal RNA small subunit methyltransferase G n=1 Tax=Meiothermus luteus TaxID=2026184 RepID=A0A399ENX3_9DEIN|nr:16S rRNA (guanine(527)-N(7))-methyltransferase RsmG [Meiothermus luteus]RIH85223.1 Ribosomal RNA small subunit methyltransferase G [Meiothermus luteus]RMH57982.1 MAG: 16S rRNA (guanine(527)-N(7))-methyltransferase RsmG [Deinococcota bacterium]